jgi:hypothetical protein
MFSSANSIDAVKSLPYQTALRGFTGLVDEGNNNVMLLLKFKERGVTPRAVLEASNPVLVAQLARAQG